jgi:hypothetical protein
MKEVVIQGFVLRDIDDDNVVEEIKIDFQKIDGSTVSKTINISAGLSFFQEIFDIIKEEI